MFLASSELRWSSHVLICWDPATKALSDTIGGHPGIGDCGVLLLHVMAEIDVLPSMQSQVGGSSPPSQTPRLNRVEK